MAIKDIHVVDVERMSDQHVRSEYNYIRKIIPTLINRCNTRKCDIESKTTPPKYVTGMTNGNFFKTKIKYLYGRLLDLYNEITEREINVKFKPKKSKVIKNLIDSDIMSEIYRDYTPSEWDVWSSGISLYVNAKHEIKAGKYKRIRWYGQKLSLEEYKTLIQEGYDEE